MRSRWPACRRPRLEARGEGDPVLPVDSALLPEQRFEQAPQAPGTQRLFYLTSRLNTEGTPIEGWKLLLATSPAKAPRRVSR